MCCLDNTALITHGHDVASYADINRHNRWGSCVYWIRTLGKRKRCASPLLGSRYGNERISVV